MVIMLATSRWDQYERNKCLIGENANMKGCNGRRLGTQWGRYTGWIAAMRAL